jgi:hypothetical protein
MPTTRTTDSQVSESSIPLRRSTESYDSSPQRRQPSSKVSPARLARMPLADSGAGWQLGSDPEIQVATVVSNHLTAGIMKYFGDSFRFGPAVNLFEKLVVKEGEIACLLAQSYLGMSEYRPISLEGRADSPSQTRK